MSHPTTQYPPTDTSCPFCEIVAGRAEAEIIREWPDAIAIRPRSGGVTAGHLLVLPRVHVPDAAADPVVSGSAAVRALELMAELPNANLITSRGPAATQTVYHLHWHVLPREEDDGLVLPWTAQPAAPRTPVDGGMSTDLVNLVAAREPLTAGPSVFLAGPTPERGTIPSWRLAAVDEPAVQRATRR